MSTSLRLVGTPADRPTVVNSPLVRAEHDQKYVVRHADRELERLATQRPDLRDRLASMREEFSKTVDQMGAQFRKAGGRDYLGFAQRLAGLRRELSASFRQVVGEDQAPLPVRPLSPPTLPGPTGTLDIRA